jgi:hypothetical protein
MDYDKLFGKSITMLTLKYSRLNCKCISKKIKPYIAFLNIHQLERQGADIQSKVEELEELIKH